VTDRAEPHLTPFPALVELIGASDPVARAREAFRHASATAAPVAIVAEPGLDVRETARLIHESSARRTGPFVAADCVRPDAARLDQEIFAGAASRGTLVLLSLDQRPTPLQARLARVLRDGRVTADGAGGETAFEGRIIAGVARSLEDVVREGALRRDLCARFSVRLELPPLRFRPSDVPMLVGCLVGDAADAARVPVPAFSREALALLAALPWRRNFAELREVLDVLVRAAVGGTVRLEDVLDHVALEPVVWSDSGATNLRDARLGFERHYIARALARHCGRMDEAARSLGMQRTNLYRKVRQLGIGVPRTR
jgi:DNA-binding NtrC family response regulator